MLNTLFSFSKASCSITFLKEKGKSYLQLKNEKGLKELKNFMI